MFVRLEFLPPAFNVCPVVNGYCANCRQGQPFSVVSSGLKRLKVTVWQDDAQALPGWTSLPWRSRFCQVCGWWVAPPDTPGSSRLGKRQRIFQLDHNECVYCGSVHQLTLDHLIPRSRGGTDNPTNLVTACEACNRQKANGEPARLQFGRFRTAANS